MANKKSAFLTNLDLQQGLKADVHQIHGRTRVRFASLAKVVGDGNGSLFSFFRVDARDVPVNLFLMSDAIAGLTNIDVGLMQPNVLGDPIALPTPAPNILVDALNISAGFPFPTEMLGRGAAGVDPANYGKNFYELAGIVAPPEQGTQYDVVMDLVTAGANAGDLTLALHYTAGD